MRVSLPNNWRPRDYQLPAWKYLERGGKHAELIWHRRSGKDEISLHFTAIAALTRPAGYWHMLPKANQARKAIWDAVNPHTGIRRIDEAFPHEIRAATRENEMFIKFVNGSTWQVLGSDNFSGAIGSPPAGIVWSEWALANPSARGYLRPIIAENNGHQVFITTPRGKNHAHSTFQAAKKNPDAFAQRLTIEDTGILTKDRLVIELQEYIDTYGDDIGNALFQQEYYCSFDAAILGAYYAAELVKVDKEGRICTVPHDPNLPVHTAWDIGWTDDTSIWVYQVVRGEIHILDYISGSYKNVDYFASQLLGVEVEIELKHDKLVVRRGKPIPGLEHRTAYKYGEINLPHDARAKTFAARGKSVHEQLIAVFGVSNVHIVPSLSKDDGRKAVRQILSRCYFDERTEQTGVEALRQYRREWDDKKKCFKDDHVHDWTSHPADAFRMLAVAYRHKKPDEKPIKHKQPTLNDLWKNNANKSRRI